jgi:hypothetical protein
VAGILVLGCIAIATLISAFIIRIIARVGGAFEIFHAFWTKGSEAINRLTATTLNASPPVHRHGSSGFTTSRSRPPHDRSAVPPEAETMNQTVPSRFTPTEQGFFEPALLRASSNSLNVLASNIRTKMAVVRLLRRKWAEKDKKGLKWAIEGSWWFRTIWPGMAAFCSIPTANPGAEKACREWGDWRRERSCRQTLSVRRETGRW